MVLAGTLMTAIGSGWDRLVRRGVLKWALTSSGACRQAMTRYTASGADDNSPRAEEPREGKACPERSRRTIKRGLGVSLERATAPLTIT